MSSTGAVVGAVVGGVIGYFVTGGNPYGAVQGAIIGYGLVSGVEAYNDLSKSRRREPSALDQRSNAGDYGAVIPISYGKVKVPGILIWGRDLWQVEVSGGGGGGKGGGGGGSASAPSSSWETYASFAVKLGKGQIVGISRLWLDDKIVYDNRDINTGATYISLGSSSITLSGGKDTSDHNLPNGNAYVFGGSDDQLPSSTIESYLGAGNVNAHRGDAYIVFDSLRVTQYGKRIPNVVAEVVMSGEFSTIPSASYYIMDPYNGDTSWYGQMIMSPSGVVWDKYTNRILTKNQVSSNAPGSKGWNIEAIVPGTHEKIYRVSTQEGANDGLRTWHWSLDPLAPYAWLLDQQYLNVISLENGQTFIRSTKTGLTGYTNTSVHCAVVVSSKNQVWISTSVNKIFVMNRESILSGATMAQAKVTEIAITVPQNSMRLLYVPHRDWIVVQATFTFDSMQFAILNSSGGVVRDMAELFPGAMAGLFTMGSFQVDEINDCLWAIAGFGVRRLYRFDLATLSEVMINTESGWSVTLWESFTLDTLSGEVLLWSRTNRTIKRLNFAGTLLSEIDLLGDYNLFGDPYFLRHVPTTSEIAVFWPATAGHIRFYADNRLSSTSPTITNIITDIAEQVGISAGSLSLSAINAAVIPGLALNSRSEARSAIDVLKRVGFFDLVIEDGLVKAKKFGASSVMTIRYEDLIIPDDTDAKRPYQVTRKNETDLPQTMEVAYSDVDFDYETQIQTASRITRHTKEKAVSQINAAISGTQARQSAEVMLYQTWASRISYVLNCSRKHWALNAGDPFTFIDELGVSRSLLCVKRELLGMTRMTVEAVSYDSTVFTATASGAGSSWIPTALQGQTLKRVMLLDIPIIKDEHDYPGFYAIADSTAPGAALLESVDGGITYNSLGTLQEASTGYTTTTLGNFTAGNVWDDLNTVTVTLHSGTLESVTDQQALAGLNAAVIGNEIVQYANAALVSGTTYTLSRLLRGRRGTEWAISAHGSGERFVPLASSLTRIQSSASGVLRYYKAVRFGAVISEAPALPFTNSQAGMKPYSVVSIDGSRDGSNNLTITWARRSRIGTAWGVTDTLPLDDTVESYQVDVMSGSIVKRTISSSTPTCTYSAADQTTDFGSVQLSLLVNVYQMSTIVGRGTVSVKTI